MTISGRPGRANDLYFNQVLAPSDPAARPGESNRSQTSKSSFCSYARLSAPSLTTTMEAFHLPVEPPISACQSNPPASNGGIRSWWDRNTGHRHTWASRRRSAHR